MLKTAADPLYLSAELPSPYGLRIISTTSHFARAVGKDRERIAVALRGLLAMPPQSDLYFAGQNHGNSVQNIHSPTHAVISGPEHKLISECDALTVTKPDTAVTIRTADCVPIVLSSSSRRWVSVIHAGWRGTLAGIMEKSIDDAISAGIDPVHLHIWIGPRISGEAYEVSQDLADEFDDKFTGIGNVTRGRFLDLGRANAFLARARGIPEDNVVFSSYCTYSETHMFPSYRRDGECRGQIYTAALLLR